MNRWLAPVLLAVTLAWSPAARAQTPWPAMQAQMYPYVESMLQTRPEQTVLLGEGEQQTGIFYASVAEAYTEEIQTALLADAEEKDWRLLSVVRLGTSYIMTMSKQDRMLDLRLTNTANGVDAVYSVMMNQSKRK